MNLFQERIDRIEQLVKNDKMQEALDEYRTLFLFVNKLDSDDKPEVYRKTELLGDKIIIKMLKLKLNRPVKIVEKDDIKKQIEIKKFYDKLGKYQEICDLIQKENYLGALGKFNKC